MEMGIIHFCNKMQESVRYFVLKSISVRCVELSSCNSRIEIVSRSVTDADPCFVKCGYYKLFIHLHFNETLSLNEI